MTANSASCSVKWLPVWESVKSDHTCCAGLCSMMLCWPVLYAFVHCLHAA